ncbi:glycosyl transferase family 2 [Bacillus paralicheniformis]|uniref:glycosyltransferase n=1 Tax=Bacillus paralicheniformis TaxID=1648923 RepID=UPI000D830942|nr:glycosyltransferase [Bacillus paralicheniformis]QSG00562.1 glycosyl transferase family 2 [Bacillus paralicheniformis]
MSNIDQRLTTIKQKIARLTKEIAVDKATISEFNQNKSLSVLNNRKKKLADLRNSQTAKSSPASRQNNIMTPAEKEAYLQFLKKNHKKGYYEEIQEQIKQLPDSNGSKYYKKLDLEVGIIADEFLFKSLEDAAGFHYINYENYRNFGDKIDVFVLATAWRGLDGSWKGLGNPKIKKIRDRISSIIEFYRSKDIPIVFYSKEDPVNYEFYIDLAQQADHIFTTCQEVLDDYRRDCPSAKTFDVLEFGVNPIYHNPIGTRMFRRQDILFAGSWYHKYPNRQHDSRILFDGVLNAGRELTIIDRNFSLQLPAHFYPKEYVPYVVPSTDHETLQKIHKMYDFTLNLNSVKDSNTMFANRVYELQAMGTVVLSNYSIGINSKYPNVFLAPSKGELTDYLNSLSAKEIYELQMQGVRKVLNGETAFDRVNKIAEITGLKKHKFNKKVLVVTKKDTPEMREQFNRQSYPYKTFMEEKDVTEQVYAEHDMVAFFGEDYCYGEYYLEDMINGFKYTDSDYITKDAYYRLPQEYVPGVEHQYVNEMKDRYRTLFWRESFDWKSLKDIQPGELLKGYSIDPLEILTALENKQENEIKTYKLSVIIPTYNNGEHLRYKCFQSLSRSSIFEDMEIIIVDDGSTDGYTPYIVKRLQEKYPNVKTHFYPQGGSGSASRPRNKGLDLSTSEWVTYLDPDNEAINDGYAALLEEAKGSSYDMVIGDMVRLSDQEQLFSYYKTMMGFNNGRASRKGPHGEFLKKTYFKAMSIQALVANRKWLMNSGIKMVEGAIGEDTLVFHEMILSSRAFKVIDLPIHIYYAMVENSSVNNINKRFFERYVMLEKGRIAWLKKEGLLEDYQDIRLENYVKNWYMVKLTMVNEEEKDEARNLLVQILRLYEGMKWKDQDILNLLKSEV